MEAPTLPLRTPAGRRLFKGVVAVGMGLVGVAVLALVLNGEDDTLRLDELPEGVTAHELGGDDVFIIRAPAALDDADFSRPFNSGPRSFCEDPVASPRQAVPAGRL